MSDADDTPTELRDEVEKELDDLERRTAEEEQRRMQERVEQGVDDPS